jgi:amino acid transporter
MPPWLVHTNRRGCPAPPIVGLGVLAAAIAIVLSLEALVQVASLAFLALFASVNAIAWKRLGRRRGLPLVGALGTAVAAVVVFTELARSHVEALVLFGLALVIAAGAHLWTQRSRPASGAKSAPPPPRRARPLPETSMFV